MVWCLEFGIYLDFGAWNLGFQGGVARAERVTGWFVNELGITDYG